MTFDIRKISYYQSGNDFSGSIGLFNYKLIPESDKIKSYIWYGKYCFKKSQPLMEKEFEMTTEGLEQISTFLNDEYEKYTQIQNDKNK